MNPLLQETQDTTGMMMAPAPRVGEQPRRVDDAFFIHRFNIGACTSVDMKSDVHPTLPAHRRSTILSQRLNFAAPEA